MRLPSRLIVVVLAGFVAAAGPLSGQVEAADPVHDTFQPGDVFVGANDGKVEWRLPDGTKTGRVQSPLRHVRPGDPHPEPLADQLIGTE